MSNCSRDHENLILSAGHDLDQVAEAGLRAHLAVCPSCERQLTQFRQVISTARSAFDGDLRLPAGVVRRIAVEAAARQASWWSRLAVLPLGLALPRPAVAAAAALLVALMSLQVINTKGRPGLKGAEEVRIDMRMEGGEVRLAWSDGRGRAYTVRKSSDPAGVAGSETHVVRGNAWVDSDPGPSPIVYYQVE